MHPRISLIFLFPVILFLGCKAKEDHRVIRLAHTLDTSHPVHKAMEYMGEELKEISGGKMELKIYSGGQLGAERECLELLQMGSLDITKVSAAVMENFVEEYQVLSIPYLFRDKEHFYNMFDGAVGEKILRSGEDFRLIGLCFYDAGSRSFYTKERPIKNARDVEGLKIRVQESKTAIEMVRKLGGAPTPISWGELYTALQQGVVDGAENNPPSFYLSRHYEVCKFYSLNEHVMVPDVLMIGREIWNELNDEEKSWLKEAADRSSKKERVLWQKSEEESLAAVKKEGVEIIRPSKQSFMEELKSMKNNVDNPKIQQLINEIEQIQ
ncbi:C4-dicarboxylate ABC transporter substrate-binding protein [Marivirga lumbricoides]|uniref:C4-dicarboxylate ABC transporter substrate-binding protein n=1 Tax=Marivirga lumbricoides TaxID=1046115 RepID=A0ABQ1MZF5_9BACT|nr:C4-dicarboxylate ABC transporter substrate-binding protein [Marivirga lumbricoides]